jgi:glutamyl-tRNA synthetase
MHVLQSLHDLHDVPKKEDVAQWVTANTIEQLEILQERIASLDAFTTDSLKILLKDVCAHYAIKLVMLAQPIRLALTATTASPGIVELMILLGKEETLRRLQKFSAHSKVFLV